MNEDRIITEMAALVLWEPSPVRRRVVLTERYGENLSAAYLSLTALEFVGQELGERAVALIQRRHREQWLLDLNRREARVTDYSRKRPWPRTGIG